MTRTTQRPRASPATIASSAGSSVSRSTSVMHVVDAARPEVVGEPRPQRPARPDRHVRAVHAQQRDPAQDEREDRRGELGPGRRSPTTRPRRRSGASAARRAASPRRRCRRPQPSGRFERPAGRRDLVAGEEPGGAEAAQPVHLVRLAGRRPDLVAARREDRDGHAADAPGRTGDEDRPVARREPARSRASTLIAAVNPAVPIAIASRVRQPVGERHRQSAGIRASSPNPP